MISFANPTNRGVANSSSMIVPCIVNSSLYCWSDTTWVSGPNSWARMIIAITPAARKKQNDVIRYRCPMILWSVVRAWSRSAPCCISLRCLPRGDGLRCLLCGDPLAEPRRADNLHYEQHPTVVETAQLCTAADEGPGPGRGDLEVVRMAGDHVALEFERDDPEGVDDVPRGQVEAHGLIGRDHQLRQLPGHAARRPRLPVDRHITGRRPRHLILRVLELPAPLVADDVDHHVGAGGQLVDVVLVPRREVEQDADHDERHDRVDHLDRQVVSHLMRRPVRA